MTIAIYSLAELEARWRPAPDRPASEYYLCEYTFRDHTCEKWGPHYCEPRADRVITFFERMLRHTKGRFRRKPFVPRQWQEYEILRPLFGEVVWDYEVQDYVRRYRIAYIIVARKNGKSELAAGILLYLLLGDDEEFAEVYSAAADTKQAGKVFEPAQRMRELSPLLSKSTKYNRNARRIIYEKTASYYEIITAQALGELGHNPHGFNLDEVLSQPDSSLWDAMTSAAGTRDQELLFATSTETSAPYSFGANLIDEAERIQEDPARAPHVFSFVRKLPNTEEGLERLQRLYPGHRDLPLSIDPFDERNWKWANPGLDEFKSREAMRRQLKEAQNEPSKENSFRQFQCNQRVAQAFRWMPMNLYAESSGDIWPSPDWGVEKLQGRVAWGGMDLSAKFDLSAWCLLFPPAEPGGPIDAFWRFWVPEYAVEFLDKHNDRRFSQWIRDGWIVATEGNVMDYDRINADIKVDAARFKIVGIDCDEWSMWPQINSIAKICGLNIDKGELLAYRNTYDRMTPGMNAIMRLVKQGRFAHHGNPVAEFCFDSVQVRKAPYNPELIRPDKPERDKEGKRIDAVPTAAMAGAAYTIRGDAKRRRSAYEDHRLESV